jgi:hypothetical protein
MNGGLNFPLGKAAGVPLGDAETPASATCFYLTICFYLPIRLYLPTSTYLLLLTYFYLPASTYCFCLLLLLTASAYYLSLLHLSNTAGSLGASTFITLHALAT